jgi:hypothetical protein
VSYLIAKFEKAHTIGETLVLPCAKALVGCLLDEKSAKLIETVPLSNNTVARRIDELATDFKNQLKKHVSFLFKKKHWLLRL